MEFGAEPLAAPVLLFEHDAHAIYWLGAQEQSAFRCNVYLIKDGDTGVLVDPGGRSIFDAIRSAVEKVLPLGAVTGVILCHQDPDVSASLPQWLDINGNLKVFTSPRTQVLIAHYGRQGYDWHDVEANPAFTLPSGAELVFIPAPFLHSPGAFVTFDPASGFLFSGDIWGALDFDWRLKVRSFDDHVPQMDLFHTEYMASNLAARGFVKRIEHLPITAILPQHGGIMGREMVPSALDYLRNLRCGLDIIYAGLQT